MTPAAERTPDFDSLERDAQARLGKASRRREQLALDSLTDTAAREEMAKVEHELGECEHELQRIALARAELERREAAARQAEQDERQQAAIAEARELQVRREKAAKVVDQAAAKHVEAVVEYVGICQQQQAKLTEAGRPQWARGARPFGYAIEAAFAYALRRGEAGDQFRRRRDLGPPAPDPPAPPTAACRQRRAAGRAAAGLIARWRTSQIS